MIRYHQLRVGAKIRQKGSPLRAVVTKVRQEADDVWADCLIIQYSDGPLVKDDPRDTGYWGLSERAAGAGSFYVLPPEVTGPVKATSMIPASVYMEKFGI